MLILSDGFEGIVRSRLGVNVAELGDPEINDRLVAGMAESYIIKRVPEYESITDEFEQSLLESAVIAYVCYLLAPSMERRVNIEVQTIDVKWKKGRVDWNETASRFLADVEQYLSMIESVEIAGSGNYPLGVLINFQGGEQ